MAPKKLADDWEWCWQTLGLTTDRDHYDELVARYSEPHRAYHTLQHLEECLGLWWQSRDLCQHPEEVGLALWFHDAVYDTHASDNEARSAQLARDVLLQATVSHSQTQRIVDLILATTHTEAPTTPDGQILIDIDLAILGADHNRFAEYEEQVRQEYHWVDEITFRSARAAILERFLARPSLFQTTWFRECFESQARANLAWSISRLKTA